MDLEKCLKLIGMACTTVYLGFKAANAAEEWLERCDKRIMRNIRR